MFNFTKRERIILTTAVILMIALCGTIMISYQKNDTEPVQITHADEEKSEPVEHAETVEDIEKKQIAVHVKGQVKNPSVVYLEEGKRVIDAVQEAGGALENADLNAVNLAAYIQDGQEIYIPAKGEIAQQTVNPNTNNTAVKSAGPQKSGSTSSKININTADAKELEKLPGIGAAIAQRIIDYRNKNGNFSQIEEIQNVSGIGPARFEQIKDLIDVR